MDVLAKLLQPRYALAQLRFLYYHDQAFLGPKPAEPPCLPRLAWQSGCIRNGGVLSQNLVLVLDVINFLLVWPSGVAHLLLLATAFLLLFAPTPTAEGSLVPATNNIYR